MSITERLKEFRLQVSTNKEAFCKEITDSGFQTSLSTIYGYETGSRQPSVSYISALVKLYNANPNWLLFGEGEMFRTGSDALSQYIPANLNLENYIFIPVINLEVSAGPGSIVSEIEKTEDFISLARDFVCKATATSPEKIVGFKVRGDSMNGGADPIKNGSIVLVDTNITQYVNDGVYVVAIDDALFVKRLQYLPKKIRVKSDNPAYEPFEVDPVADNFKVIGCVKYTINNVSCLE